MKTIVIGAGPAGAACALWLHQLGCPVLLVEKATQAGGLQLFSPYENFWVPCVSGLKGQEIGGRIHQHLQYREVPLQTGRSVARVEKAAEGFVVRFEDGGCEAAAQVVLATGTRFKSGGFKPSAQVALGPGRGIESIDVAGKRVAILGGGDNAFDQYVFAKRRGAADCKIFARTLRAQKKLQLPVPSEDVRVGPFTADQETLQVNGESFDVFSVMFGFEPVIPQGLEELARSPQGFVEADHWGQTSVPGVYAAGEVAHTFHPCVTTSFAHGVQAAKHIQRKLGL